MDLLQSGDYRSTTSGYRSSFRFSFGGSVSYENLFLLNGPNGPVPKLLDTGLSLLRAGQPVMGARVLVAPEYLSPERICGQRADPGSDIYGLGILLFELRP